MHIYLSDDIRSLEFADRLDVLLYRPVMVAFAVQMVPILAEDVHYAILVILLRLCQAET